MNVASLLSLRAQSSLRFLARAGAVALLLANLALAQATTVCTTSSSVGQGAVFNVFAGGAVSASQSDANGQCNPWFYNGSVLNGPVGSFTEPGKASAGTLCNNHSLSPAAPMTMTGTPATAVSLPTYQYNSNTYSVSYANSSQVSYGGNYYNLTGSSQSITSNGRSFTAPAQNAAMTIPSDVYGDWGTLSAQNGTTIALKGNASGVRINTLSLSGCNGNGKGATLAAGNYYIQTLSIQAGCNITLSDSGPVNLYILNSVAFNGGTSCFNFVNCGTVTQANLAAQAPSNLKIWVYNGDVTFQNAIGMAASLYVQNGNVNMSQGGNFAFVGEMFAQNITFQNNATTYFYYSPTGAVSSSSSSSSTYRIGNYALAPAALPPMAKTGDYAYFAEQQDTASTDTSAQAISGHLFAVPLGANGSASASQAWDAASLMTVAQRQASIMTQSSAGALVALANVDAAAFGGSSGNATNIVQAIFNPNYQSGAWLNGRAPTSLLGRPWRTAPVLAGNLVVIGSDDGMLYAFDKTSGALVWGFFPRENLPAAAAPGTLMNSHPWGQIAAYSSGGSTYVAATGMQGALHMALKLNADGSIGSVAWKDYQSGAVSPAAPFGGAAPSMAVDQSGSAAGKVAYIVGNSITRRALADGSGAATAALPSSATSNLLYLSDSAAYYGDSTGSVRGLLGAVSPGSLGESSPMPILNVSGAYLPGSAPGSLNLVLLANSATKLAALKLAASGATWAMPWQFSAASTAGAPNLPASGAITAEPTVSESLVYIPVTVGSDPCSQVSEEIGPLALTTGAVSLASVNFRDASMSSAINVLGTGEALFAPAAALNGRRYVFADGNGGSALPGDGWGQYSKPVTSLSGISNMRLNWRELTSFFTARLRLPDFLGSPSDVDPAPASRDYWI